MQRGLRGNTFLSFFSPGNKFSFRASRVYQDRRFKFILVVPVRYAPLARIVTRLFGGATGCNILRHRARSLEYRCSHFCGFSSAHGTRYFFGEFFGSFLAVTFTSDHGGHIIIPRSKFLSSIFASYRQKAIPQPRIWLHRYARTVNTATICQMFNCSNVRQYIFATSQHYRCIAAFVRVYKFTRCLRDTYTLFTLPTSNLEFERVYGFWVSHVRN